MSYLPDISVVVCAYNHDKWIERCIRSINHQKNIQQQQFEIIVVNDGSTDYTKDVLNNLEDIDNIKIIHNEDNFGLPKSLNNAIKMSKGRYIIRVDSDDFIGRNCLFLTMLFLDMNRKYQAVAVDYSEVDEFENFIRTVNCSDEQIACGIMFRKECLFDIGLYDEKFLMREGHELRKRFEKRFEVGRLEFPLYKYRKYAHNRTNNVQELRKYDEKL